MSVYTMNTSWAVLSNSATVAFQVVGAHPVEIGLGTNNVAPSAGFIYAPGYGDRGAITTLFPTESGNTIWGRSSAGSSVYVG
jgi:hypothetical protein